MEKFDHKACFLFDRCCRKRGIEPESICESQVTGERRPDFKIKIGNETAVVEVKAVETNKEDQRNCERKQAGKAVVYNSGSMHNTLRRKLRRANDQLRPYVEKGIPGLVCFIDYTDYGLFTYLVVIHRAMFGEDIAVVSKAQPSLLSHYKSGGKETLTDRHNTSISGVLTIVPIKKIDQHSIGFSMRLFHNHFARHPIDRNFAAHFTNEQYESGMRERSIGDPWRRIEVKNENSDALVVLNNKDARTRS